MNSNQNFLNNKQARYIKNAGISMAKAAREALVSNNRNQINPEFVWDETCFVKLDANQRITNNSLPTYMKPCNY